jgi:hypothetical protein
MSDDRELLEHLERLHAAGTSQHGLVSEDDLKDMRDHMARTERPDGRCFYCGQPADRFHPLGPITITVSDPDIDSARGEPYVHEFCIWECFSHWAATQSGGRFVVDQADHEAFLETLTDYLARLRGRDDH